MLPFVGSCLATAAVYWLVCSNDSLLNDAIGCLSVVVQQRVFASFTVRALRKYAKLLCILYLCRNPEHGGYLFKDNFLYGW
jgi:hypothetical protein